MDEKALLEALSRVGFGNWKDVTDYINNILNREISEQEVINHYYDHYVNGLIGKISWAWIFTNPVIRFLHRFPHYYRPEESILVECSNFQNDVAQSEFVSLGYLNKRDDLEREFDNEAETIISNITLNNENDDELEKKFKLVQLDIYRRRLINRYRIKNLIKAAALINLFCEIDSIKEIPTTKKEINLKCIKDAIDNNSFVINCVNYLLPSDIDMLYYNLSLEHIVKILLKKFIVANALRSQKLSAEERMICINSFGQEFCDSNQNLADAADCNQMKDKSPRSLNRDSTKFDLSHPIDEDFLRSILNDDEFFCKESNNTMFLREIASNDFIHSLMVYFKQIISNVNIPEITRFITEIDQKAKDFYSKTTIYDPKNALRRLHCSSIIHFKADKEKKKHKVVALSESEKHLCNELQITSKTYRYIKNIIIQKFLCFFYLIENDNIKLLELESI
ncbi:hypothetical protein QR98_0052890 [Sarcoptes scabiei]|uniref:Uncharacterized protein n=1 Tax=Sarcoptes scabiei TaxID=52283 RepID=A0A132A8Q7_SARSC|nr:hypothetical protein QR98_0052890 [Sarcoptes scabiei]